MFAAQRPFKEGDKLYEEGEKLFLVDWDVQLTRVESLLAQSAANEQSKLNLQQSLPMLLRQLQWEQAYVNDQLFLSQNINYEVAAENIAQLPPEQQESLRKQQRATLPRLDNKIRFFQERLRQLEVVNGSLRDIAHRINYVPPSSSDVPVTRHYPYINHLSDRLAKAASLLDAGKRYDFYNELTNFPDLLKKEFAKWKALKANAEQSRMSSEFMLAAHALDPSRVPRGELEYRRREKQSFDNEIKQCNKIIDSLRNIVKAKYLELYERYKNTRPQPANAAAAAAATAPVTTATPKVTSPSQHP